MSPPLLHVPMPPHCALVIHTCIPAHAWHPSRLAPSVQATPFQVAPSIHIAPVRAIVTPPSHMCLISPRPHTPSVPFNTAAPRPSIQSMPTSSVLAHAVVKPCACAMTLQPTCASPASACRALVHHIHAEPAPSSLPRCVPYAAPKLACAPSSIPAASTHRYHPSVRCSVLW